MLNIRCSPRLTAVVGIILQPANVSFVSFLRKRNQPEPWRSSRMESMAYTEQVNPSNARAELWYFVWIHPSGARHSFPQLAEVLPVDGSSLIPPQELPSGEKELLHLKLCPFSRSSPDPVTSQCGSTKIQSSYLNLGQVWRIIPAPELLWDLLKSFLQFPHSSTSSARSCFLNNFFSWDHFK